MTPGHSRRGGFTGQSGKDFVPGVLGRRGNPGRDTVESGGAPPSSSPESPSRGRRYRVLSL